MSLEVGAVGATVLKAVLPKVVTAIFTQLSKTINSKLNPSEVEKALRDAIAASEKPAQKVPEQGLFYHCDDKQKETFLAKVLEYSAVQAELGKPIAEQGTPNREILQKSFTKIADDTKIQLNESGLKAWIDTFVNTYFEKTSTYLRFQVAKENYCRQLTAYFDDVKFAGIAVEGQDIEKAEKLAQIFVVPDVVEEVQKRLERLEAVANPEQQTSELIRQQQQRLSVERFSGKKILASALFSQTSAKKIVLLGAPGSGKSTLSSYFAVMLAQKQPEKLGLDPQIDWLPILIRMREFAKSSNTHIADYARQFAEKTMTVKTLPDGFFEYWLERGQAVILLDGLDEVTEESKRYQVVDIIDNFLKAFEQNRAIVTSRPAGYKRDFFRTDEFTHYQLQEFDHPKIEEFIQHWYDSRCQDKAESQSCQESLKKALNQNDRIKLLARNPLQLSIIALIHRYQANLPKQRHELYNRAVETLLKSWDAYKDISSKSVLKYLDLDDLRRLMERLAYCIHTQGNRNHQEGGTLIETDELIGQLTQFIREQQQIESYKAKEEAKRFIEFIQSRTGLLNEQGQDYYGFVHKTFQEYLCAAEIHYRADDEDKFEIVLNHIREHLHDPHWREVLLLLITQQKPKKAAKAIQAVLNCGSEYEQWLHRDLFFSASCLAENPKDLKATDPSLVTKILQNLVDLETSQSSQVTYKMKNRIFQLLCRLSKTQFEFEALQLLKDKSNQIDQVRLQEYRVSLGEKEEAILILLEYFNTESEYFTGINYSETSQSAAQALTKLDNASETVVSALINYLEYENSEVRFHATSTLGNLGNTSQRIVNALTKRLDDSDWQVVSSAADALIRLGNVSDNVVDALIKHLDDNYEAIRMVACVHLGELGNDSPKVVDGLSKCLEDPFLSVGLRAAEALGNLLNVPNELVDTFIESLDDEYFWVSYINAFSLGKLSNTSERVVKRLIECLGHPDSSVRSSAAEALGNLGNTSETVVNALINCLDAHQDVEVRDSAAEALGKLGNTSETVVNALINCLDAHQNSMLMLRTNAAKALGKLGNTSETVVDALTKCLESHEFWLSSSAADALGQLGNASDTVVSALIDCFQDGDSTLRSSAAQALGQLGQKSPDVLPAVVQWIEQNQDSEYIGDGIDALWDLVVSE